MGRFLKKLSERVYDGSRWWRWSNIVDELAEGMDVKRNMMMEGKYVPGDETFTVELKDVAPNGAVAFQATGTAGRTWRIEEGDEFWIGENRE